MDAKRLSNSQGCLLCKHWSLLGGRPESGPEGHVPRRSVKKLTHRMQDGFFAHMQAFFLTFRTPKMTSDEFLMTQNVYRIFEGPHYADCASVWTDYHRFAPVSPKIMIVLRSNPLSHSAVEGGETQRQMMLEQMKSTAPKPPQTAGSCLDDLPVAKAGNNYSRVVDRKRIPLPPKMSKDQAYIPFSVPPPQSPHACAEDQYDRSGDRERHQGDCFQIKRESPYGSRILL